MEALRVPALCFHNTLDPQRKKKTGESSQLQKDHSSNIRSSLSEPCFSLAERRGIKSSAPQISPTPPAANRRRCPRRVRPSARPLRSERLAGSARPSLRPPDGGGSGGCGVVVVGDVPQSQISGPKSHTRSVRRSVGGERARARTRASEREREREREREERQKSIF